MSGSGDYINREAAKKRAIAIPLGGKFVEVVPVGEIEALPAADVRPVVYCRECIHGQGKKMDFWNEYEGIECIGGVVHRKDWFCADGEKREES